MTAPNHNAASASVSVLGTEGPGGALAAMVAALADAIYVADPESHELLFFNDAFTAIWGPRSIGERCFRVIHESGVSLFDLHRLGVPARRAKPWTPRGR